MTNQLQICLPRIEEQTRRTDIEVDFGIPQISISEFLQEIRTQYLLMYIIYPIGHNTMRQTVHPHERLQPDLVGAPNRAGKINGSLPLIHMQDA